jgi:flavin reductase (DIM6/NTAB) family NADH-FMN oxidoreductase RutF
MSQPLDLDAKKSILRQFTYGLYAITAAHNGERGVFTANWLTQVSFDPPLVLLSIELDSATLPLIRGSGRFTICPFDTTQTDLAGSLGRPKRRAGDKFATLDLPIVETATGDLALANALGYVVCHVISETPAGDSVAIIGEVIDARVLNDGDPLTMRAAGFRHAG